MKKSDRYTSSKKNIEERIKDGMTKFFEPEEIDEARKFATHKGSYVSDCFQYNEKSFEWCGFIVSL